MKNITLAIIPISLAACLHAEASLTITFDFTPPFDPTTDTVLSAGNQAIFTDAGNFWTSKLTGYLDGVDRTITIKASGFSEAASGGGILLGLAGPEILTVMNHGGKEYTIAETGSASFNVHPDALESNGLINAKTVRHEVGHIIGAGTLWFENSLYTDGTGQYTGANGILAFNQEFGQNSTFVPVELDGGSGTADGHWNEGNTPTLTVQSGTNMGENLDDALMTGDLSGSAFLSDTSLGMFQDLGFNTVAFSSVPEPSSTLLLGLGSFALILRRKK